MGDTAYYLLNAAAGAPGNGRPYRTATLNGREFWVVPFVSLVEGVLNGSKGPLYYPRDEIRRNPGAWNGIPLTLGHPTDSAGRALNGRSPEVADRFGLGWVYNDWADEFRRGGEAWFDKEWTRNKAPRVAAKLEAGQVVELSTGLKTEDWPAPPGSRDSKGRHYVAVAKNYGPDHLAVLDGQRGACSVADGCGIGVFNADGDMTCPKCGGTMKAGKCNECGYEAGTDLEPSVWEKAGAATAATGNVHQPHSTATGRFKEPNAGTGKGPVHQAAQAAFYAFTPSDEERHLAETAAQTDYPGWVKDQTKWARARKIATESGRDQDWPFVVGVYQRIGGTVVEKTVSNDRTCKCKQSPAGKTQGDDSMKTRAENVAFLVANCGEWEGKENVLNAKAGDDYVLDDQAIAAMAANAEAVVALNRVRDELDVPADVTANAMPAFIKAKIDAKKKKKDDDEDDDDEDDSPAKNKHREPTTVNFSNLTPQQVDQLSVAMFGQPAAVVRETVANSAQHKDREKQIVINKLTRHLPDDKKKVRQAKLAVLSLNELYDRLGDMPDDVRNADPVDLVPRVPVYGGRIVDDGGATANADDYETFDLTAMNWDRPARTSGSAA